MHAPSEKIGNSRAVVLRRMSASDVSAVLSILKESPEASIWSGESLLESVSAGMVLAAEVGGQVEGILIGLVAADEFEILNLAVAKAARRQGIAMQLVSAALESARAEGARQVYLEVRASNEAAIALYAQFGFQVCGNRPNYYREPVEDAVQLVLHN